MLLSLRSQKPRPPAASDDIDGRAQASRRGLDQSIAYLTGGIIAASIVLGGGARNGYLGDAVLQAISVVLLAVSVAALFTSGRATKIKGPLLFVALVALVPALQLVPLPTSAWSLLPGRDIISETYRLINRSQPLLPLTMSPSATWLSALSLIPPIAIFLAALNLNYAQRRAIGVVIIATALLSVAIAFLQFVQGPNSPLRFYSTTGDQDIVGFFANRNHFAALLYSALLFSAVWLSDAIIKVGLQSRRRTMESTSVLLTVFWLLAFATLIVAQMMARSRAGLGLSIVALLACLGIGVTDHRAIQSRANTAKITIGAATITIIFALQFALYRILDRFQADPLADARIPLARNTIVAAKAYMPFGSGLGTFVPVYQFFEKPSDITVTYANRAHNDLLELWLETGVIGPLLVFIFLLWFALRTFRAWRGSDSELRDIDRDLAKAASIIIALLLMHSLVDYPLRSSALLAVAAFSIAVLIPPLTSTDDLPSHSSGERDAGGAAQFETKIQEMHSQENAVSSPVLPRPREPWGQSIEWPEAWRDPKMKAKDKSDPDVS